MKKVADSLPAQDARRVQTLQLQQVYQRWLMLDARLPAILRGKDKPANASEQLDFTHREKGPNAVSVTPCPKSKVLQR